MREWTKEWSKWVNRQYQPANAPICRWKITDLDAAEDRRDYFESPVREAWY